MDIVLSTKSRKEMIRYSIWIASQEKNTEQEQGKFRTHRKWLTLIEESYTEVRLKPVGD